MQSFGTLDTNPQAEAEAKYCRRNPWEDLAGEGLAWIKRTRETQTAGQACQTLAVSGQLQIFVE